MSFFSLITKNLLRRRFRTAMTIMALATAIGSVMALSGVASGFTESFRDVYQSHRVDIVVTREGSADRLSSSLPDRFVRVVDACPGVQRTVGVLLETLSLEEQQAFGIPAMGMPVDSWMFADYRMIASSASDELPSIYLGQNVSQRTELNAGDVINIFDQPFQIGGIFETSSVWENGSIIAPLESLQELTGREGQITYINVTVNDDVPPEDIDEVTGAIESTDPKLLALPTDAFVESDTRMQMAGAMAWMTSAIALIVGAIGTLNTMMTSVMERTGEIGILRAVGWTMKRVSAVILLESIALAVIATILGGIGASVLLVALSHSDAASGVLAPSIGPGLWLRGLAIGLFIGVLGAIGPSMRAAKMPPTLALRNL